VENFASIVKALRKITLCAGLAIILSLTLFDVVGPYIERHIPGKTDGTLNPASAEVEQLSRQISEDLATRYAPVFVTNSNDLSAHTDCEGHLSPGIDCSIVITSFDAQLSKNEPMALKAILGHEYGHVTIHYKGTQPDFHWYVLPTVFVFFLSLVACTFYKTSLLSRIIVALSIPITIVMYAYFSRGMHMIDMAWEATLILMVIFALPWQNEPRSRSLAVSIFFAAAAIAGIDYGVNERNSVFRPTEIFSDMIAVRETSKTDFARVMCAMAAQDHPGAGNPYGPPSLMEKFAEWLDVHPPKRDRVTMQGLPWNCPALPPFQYATISSNRDVVQK